MLAQVLADQRLVLRAERLVKHMVARRTWRPLRAALLGRHVQTGGCERALFTDADRHQLMRVHVRGVGVCANGLAYIVMGVDVIVISHCLPSW
jgi:hypothetical protein